MRTSRVKLNEVLCVITTLLVMFPLSLCENRYNHNFFNDESSLFKEFRPNGSLQEDKRDIFGEFNLPEDEPDCSSIPFCDVCISTGLGDEVKCVLCSGRRKPSPNGDICERQGFQNFQVGVNSTEGALTPLGSFFEDSNRDN